MRLLGDLGPGIAAVIVVSTDYGAKRLRELIAQLTPRGRKWTAAAVLTPAATIVFALVCVGRPSNEVLSEESLGRWLRVFAVNLPFAPFWEELGWRGYLLPELQTVRRPLSASIVVGVIWGIWHTPLYLKTKIPGTPLGTFPICFLVLTIGLSIFFSWVYNATKGSLATVIIFHAALNSSIIVFLGPAMLASGFAPFLAVTVGVWLVAMLLLVFVGPDLAYEQISPDM